MGYVSVFTEHLVIFDSEASHYQIQFPTNALRLERLYPYHTSYIKPPTANIVPYRVVSTPIRKFNHMNLIEELQRHRYFEIYHGCIWLLDDEHIMLLHMILSYIESIENV